MKRNRGFTLIELLVVISIIALLIALLLPVLGKARESARSVVCQSNEHQMAISVFIYAEDNSGRVPQGLASGDIPYWPGRLEPYVQGDDLFRCPVRSPLAPDFSSYNANGAYWLFQWLTSWGVSGLTEISDAIVPSKVIMIKENTEDMYNPGLADAHRLFGGIQPWFNYTNSGFGQNAGGRHFRTATGAEHDAWGKGNIVFMDGHVRTVSMEYLVTQGDTVAFVTHYSFPFSLDSILPGGMPSEQSHPSAPPGAEFWTIPWW